MSFFEKLKIKSPRGIVGWVTVIYLAYFFVNAYVTRNYEFFYYAIVIAILAYILLRIVRDFYVRTLTLAGLSLTGFLNFLGGAWYPGNTRLYDTYFLGGVIKYDNITHFVGATFVGFLIVEMLLHLLGNRFPATSYRQMMFFLLAFFAAFGIVSAVEIIEFTAVGFWGVEEQVGDYYNNAIDLVVNYWGVLLSILFSLLSSRKIKVRWF